MKTPLHTMAATLTLALALAPATYGAVSATSSSADGRAAQAVFDVVDGNLVIRLTNLSNNDVRSRRDVLTGIYFDTSGAADLNYVGAGTAEGSQVVFGPDRDNLNREWNFQDGKRALKRAGSRFALGSASIGRLFKGVGNLDFGLTSLGDDPSSGGKALTGKFSLVQNEVVLVLAGVPEGFSELDITKVVFQYGTKKKHPRMVGELAMSVESLADELNNMNVKSDGQSSKRGRDPVANPAPSALAGGLVLLSALAARRRRIHG